jgi:hypothetical protein
MNEHLASTATLADRPPPELSRAQLDPLQSPALQRELPGVLIAFDGAAMCAYLQEALFGASQARYTVTRCEPAQSVYTGDCCIVRYELDVNDGTGRQAIQPLVIGRVYPTLSAASSYLNNQLAPLVARMRGREEIAVFERPAAVIEALNMVVHAFPIDGELPMLVDATDPRLMREILSNVVAGVEGAQFAIQDCQVELGHYGRQHRCVLRYHLTGTPPTARAPERVLIYGKVAADGRGALAGPVIAALRERVLHAGSGHTFTIPRLLGFLPELQLALFEAIPGVPQVAQLLKARLRGQAAGQAGQPALEEALEACARVAAALHTSGIALGQSRMCEHELASLRQGLATVEPIAPEFGARFGAWLAQAEAHAAASAPLRPCFSHGDFSYTQLIFEGQQTGLVDFDTVCQAEPALDLGQFLAYVRMAGRKGQKSDAAADQIEQLCAQFLQDYCAAAGEQLEDEQRLRMRVPIYELISLLRLALHSWQKLKGSRLEYVIAIIEERVSCLPRLS